MQYLFSIFFFISLGFSQSFGEKMVTILTEPTGAEVYLNGKPIGISPCTTRLKNGLVTPKQMIKVEKEGYKTELFELNQKINPAMGCVGLGCGFFTGVGLIALIWATEFEDSYQIFLQPNNNNKLNFDPTTGEKIK